jgi:Cu2+-exporting ATPase
VSAHQEACYHCGLPVPVDGGWFLTVLGKDRLFCCPGCQAVCRTIVDAGLEDYYRHRTTKAARADPAVVPDILKKLSLYDHPDIQRSFVRGSVGWREASLILEDIRCAACLWLNERHLRGLDGVLDVEMDYASERARVRWDPGRIQLSTILRAIADIGYIAYPYDSAHREQLLKERKRRSAHRLIFAAAVGMPVMQFSLASYIMGGAQVGGELPLWVIIGRWTTLFAAAAILSYSGQDFFVGAWRDLKNRRLGMDVPIVLGLTIALTGSLVATLQQRGEVYLDSIAMFVLFVLLARIYEMRGRVTAANAMDRLARVIPQTARRLTEAGEEEVAAVELRPGDRLRMVPGEVLPADGTIVEGSSSIDESPLTGESAPVLRRAGDPVTAGTCNIDQPIVIEVTRVGEESTAGEIRYLLDRALHSRPRYAVLAERAAEWFVAVVLLLALLTAGAWLWLDPAQALPNTIAVLIVTCPCALALATPVAVAIAAARFADMGVLPLRMSGLERLARAGVAAFDKTGTLTLGRLRLLEVRTYGGANDQSAYDLAAALEQGSEHPVGKALAGAGDSTRYDVQGRHNVPGAGVTGSIAGREWRLGKVAFALAGAELDRSVEAFIRERQEWGYVVVALSDARSLQALFVLEDEPRPGGRELPARLRDGGVSRVAVLSGDSARNAQALARRLDIPEALGDLSPADKLGWIRERQGEGARVMMVGDGINDAPTLAGADVSVSFAGATELAQYSSDFIVLADDLSAIGDARQLARRTRRVILQNLLWAASYNLLAVPAAALGYIPPWAAAIGMSASSLFVVANALRLRRDRASRRTPAEERPAASAGPEPHPRWGG